MDPTSPPKSTEKSDTGVENDPKNDEQRRPTNYILIIQEANISIATSSASRIDQIGFPIISESHLNVSPVTSANPDDNTQKSTLICRICLNNDRSEEMISPCDCKGSMAYVHRHCLERWLSQANIDSCELCKFKFPLRRTQRYTMGQSMRIWYSYSHNRKILNADILLIALLTVMTIVLTAMSIISLQYFVAQGKGYVLNSFWTTGSLAVFLSVIFMAYFFNTAMIIKDQLTPWIRWWRTTHNVKIILENQEL